jgi:glyoxylase-like metal-dependent hydrolase (beta-lactamase superfamily II)
MSHRSLPTPPTLLALAALTLTGCSTTPTSPPTPASGPTNTPTARQLPVADNPLGPVSVYTSSKWGFETNSFLLDARDGVILIDTQFLPSATEEALEKAERIYGKPVVAAIVLHPNPDKFNGTATLQQRGIRVITSAQVASLIPEVHAKRVGWFYDRYKPDYPSEEPRPEAAFDDSTTLRLAGTDIGVHVLGGPGCSPTHVVVSWQGHVFVGDLVASGHHSWLEIGETAAWLERLDEIRDLKPHLVHPGRGASGGPELLDAEEAYLRRVIELVGGESLVMPPDEQRLEALHQQLKDEYPTYGNDVFLKMGLPAEWARQARKKRDADAP